MPKDTQVGKKARVGLLVTVLPNYPLSPCHVRTPSLPQPHLAWPPYLCQ